MPAPTETLSLDTLPRRQLKALIGEMASFAARMRERGRDYAARGLVGPLLSGPHGVRALVQGTEVYEVEWEWDDPAWIGSCTCPVGFECKHAYAVACCLLEPIRVRAGSIDQRLPRLLPGRAVINTRLGHPEPPGGRGGRAAARGKRAAMTQPSDADESPDLFEDELEEIEEIEESGDEWNASGPPTGRGLRWRASRDLVRSGPGPALRAPPRRGLAEFRGARDSWARRLALQHLLWENPRVDVPLHAEPFREILAERDFELMCWLLARLLPQWTDGWLPAPLEAFRDRQDLAQRHVERTRETLAVHLTNWSARRRASPARSLRFVLGLRPPAPGASSVSVEARLTSARLRDEPRTHYQLQQLMNELHRRPGLLAPEQAEMLEAYLRGLSGWSPRPYGSEHALTTTGLQRLLECGGGGSFLVWGDSLDPDLARLGGVTAASPARLCPHPARLVPVCEAREEQLALDLRLSWPDGRNRSPSEAIILRGSREGYRQHPSFVLCEGEFSLLSEEPPLEIVDKLRHAGGLPLERERHGQLIACMAERFPSMRASLASLTRVHAVVPIVAVDLRDDDWMQIRVFAAARGVDWSPVQALPPGGVVFEYAPDSRWVASDLTAPGPEGAPFERAEPGPGLPQQDPQDPDQAKPVARESGEIARPAWLELPEESAVAPVVDWLRLTGARPGTKGGPGGRSPTASDRGVGWWLLVRRKGAVTLAEVWSRRPPDVRWFCTAAAKRLLVGTPPVAPRLKVHASGIDWFTVSAEWEAEGLRLTDEDLAALRAATGSYVRISTGWVRRDAGQIVEQTMATLADLGIEPGAGEQRLALWQLAQARPESLRAFQALSADQAASVAIGQLREQVAAFRGLPRAPLSPRFRGRLRPYQQQGLDFLAYTSSLGLGTVLADDMGLGKTVQALAWLLWLRKRDPAAGPALVVCPASIVHNWAREAERFAPGLRVVLLTSGGARRTLIREVASHDLAVTNYALLRRDIETWRAIPLGAAILDEAQNIKNPDAAVSRAALELKARHRLALTGTPLENCALDLWSIMAFVNPGYLGGRSTFSARHDRPDAPPHARRLLAARLRPVMLRRMKQEVARDLPERTEERRDCEMHPGQRRLYLAELARSRKVVSALGATADGLRRNKIEILAALTRLRQICCHPALAGARPSVGSGKFDALWEMLEPLLAEGHKVLLFSQFVRCLNLLSAEMRRREIVFHTLTGQTRRREEVVAAFQADARPSVFLISLKAGGTGLNLTAASYVVLFDPWWNPAVESQAIDRTHRIGQTRSVMAYRLLTLGTVEEKIWELQQRKAALARDLLAEDGFARSLTREDLEYLLTPAT